MNLQRKRFCQVIQPLFEPPANDQHEQKDGTKATYILETIRTFFKFEQNFYALELIEQMQNTLAQYVEQDTDTAIIFLLKNKREKFMNANDEKIKQIFGSCPFNVLQQQVNNGLKLKLEMSDECVNYVFKNKLKLSTECFTNDNYVTKSLRFILDNIEKPKDFLHFETIEKKPVGIANNSFHMTYKNTKSNITNSISSSNNDVLTLPTYYEIYRDILPGFTCEDFCNTMQQILSSKKSSNELQNELFELIGFEGFELISNLLDNREKLMMVNSMPERKPSVKGKQQSGRNNVEQAPFQQIVVQSESEKLFAKQQRKLEKKGLVYDVTTSGNDSPDDEFQLVRSVSALQMKNNPNIHDEQIDVNVKAMICGQVLNLPTDAIKTTNPKYDQVTIPPRPASASQNIKARISTSTMDKIGQMVFSQIESFNPIQSEVYPIAYHSNENMLVCAPTGAGKTNIALMTIVQQIKNFVENDVVRLERFKIVYVCPMKALAGEMTHNFSQRLLPLGITVRECTGDMQLTRREIADTQMLVTTPEKWDVITRKGTTDAELTSLLKLLIIDEVHLLNGDRGPVIEALVARTLRQVVASQNLIRIIGLSATLPNYMDIAHFLRVNVDVGLFYFDARYRSVPLSQTFIGIKSSKSAQQQLDLDEVCFDKVVSFLRQGHQVMVFVHARNQTTKTANFFKENAAKKGVTHLFVPEKRSIKVRTGSRALETFLEFGLGIHHAGMLRKDRNEVEKCFMNGTIKVLCCTATLAWGVNLPAHAVIIKGTKLYDSKKCAFVDLDILDVMQIFGRAGRPQFDTSGHGIIITSHDKMHFYLQSLTNQIPIESRLLNALTDNLNAEIVLGSVSSVQEGVEWLTFTYLHRRMRINPLEYGLEYKTLQDDPDLRNAMLEFVHKAATLLDKTQMVRYNTTSGDLTATNLGRTASYYYINFDTIEIFNNVMNATMSESDIISMMCLAAEFQQIQVRQEEMEDLDQLIEEYCWLPVPGGAENVHGKVNILMQTFLSRARIKCLSLASDMEYITQSAARIARSLFDIAIHQNKALLAGRCLLVAQMFEQQLWSYQHPMRQFKLIEMSVLQNIENSNLKINDMIEMDERQLGQAIHNQRWAHKVKHFAEQFPNLEIDAKLQPITMGVIRVKLFILAKYKWNKKTSELFWVWIENPEDDKIYHTETFSLTNQEMIELVFTIPLVEPRPSQYLVRISSDRWIGAVFSHPLSFMDLKLPESFTPHTDLLTLQPLPISALNNEQYCKLYKFSHFNPIQTQIFHCLYHTDNNILLGAPTGSGKTIVAEICILRLFNNNPRLKVVYIAPLKALVRERVEDWKTKFSTLNKNVVEITGDYTPNIRLINSAHLIITTPEKWDGISRGWATRQYIQDVGLMIIDEIHLLGEDRGPVLEVIVSRTNFISDRTGRKLRIVGLSTAMANAKDLANWLGIGDMGLYNFRPTVRPVPLEVHISGFPGKHYCPRMLSMNRPAYQAIRQHAPDSPTLIFCSSRKQTRLTAFDLITYLATDVNSKQFLHCDDEATELILSNIIDNDLKQFLSFGIGIHHAGLQERDRKTVEELFVNQKIQVLIATGTLAWGVNFPAHLVIIKGTEYFDALTKRYVDMPITDVLQMMGRAGRPQFDTSGVACVFVHDVKKNFYKKFLYEPFPVESSLLQVLPDHINAEIAAETVPTKQHLLEYLTWTYFFRRLLENPTYYNLNEINPCKINEYLSELIDSVINVLQESNCVQVDENFYESTFFGQVASFYYLSYKTMQHFQNALSNTNSIDDLLAILTQANEYATFPVRHNEDKINQEIARYLNLKLSYDMKFDSSHVKVLLLLQMYLGDHELPNQEYIVDCKSVLDQALRILQAMIDITSNCGWLSTTLRCINLLQMIIQGLWITKHELLTLPHINEQTLPFVINEFATTLNNKDCRLSHIKLLSMRQEEQVRTCFINTLGTQKSQDVMNFIKVLPWVEIRITLKQNDEPLNELVMITNAEYEFICEFQRVFDGKKQSVATKKFTKHKDEGWFLCIGCKDEMLGVKRLFIGRKSTASMTVKAPNCLGTFNFSVYLMSDSYFGFDQQFDIPVQVKAA